ncbi:MAG TPA: nitrate reductase associated protein [Steroidobacteraceae bacterium]|nr:nitrate reductase associated protein [Steroidobacteraceae bacterium]
MDTGVFGFEADFAGAMRCIPMAVRLKLDQCGVKLSLRQWNRFSREERERLLTDGCEGAAASTALREYVIRLIAARTGERAVELALEVAPAWADVQQVPVQLDVRLAERGLGPLPLAQWAALAPLQRYALLKLTRPSHDNDNLVPALREFGLLKA